MLLAEACRGLYSASYMTVTIAAALPTWFVKLHSTSRMGLLLLVNIIIYGIRTSGLSDRKFLLHYYGVGYF